MEIASHSFPGQPHAFPAYSWCASTATTKGFETQKSDYLPTTRLPPWFNNLDGTVDGFGDRQVGKVKTINLLVVAPGVDLEDQRGGGQVLLFRLRPASKKRFRRPLRRRQLRM